MPKTTVIYEGKSVEIPAEIANDKTAIVKTLIPFYPELTEGELDDPVKDAEGNITYTLNHVVKPKGYGTDDVVAALAKCKAYHSPVIALGQQLLAHPIKTETDMLNNFDAINNGLVLVNGDISYIEGLVSQLAAMPVLPSRYVPVGL